MLRPSTLISFSLLFLTCAACSDEKKFSTQVNTAEAGKAPESNAEPDPKPEAENNLIHITKSQNGRIAAPFSIKSGTLSVTFEASFASAVAETATTRAPLDVNFVLDVTSSMSVQLNAAKTGFKAFMETMKNDGFDSRFALFTFEDNVLHKAPLTTFEDFQSKLDQVKLGNGADTPEASFAALQMVMTEGPKTKRPEAIPVIILVTDAVGHNGTGASGSRDCTIDATLNAFNSEYGKAAKLFYAVPSDNQVFKLDPCERGKISDRYDEMFTKIQSQSSIPMEYRGQSLGWPFEEATLTSVIPKLLKEKIVPKAVTCEVRSYELSADGTSLAKGVGSDLKRDAKGNAVLPNVVKGEELEKLVGTPLTLEVKRCCDDIKDDGSACKNERVQKVEFNLSQK